MYIYIYIYIERERTIYIYIYMNEGAPRNPRDLLSRGQDAKQCQGKCEEFVGRPFDYTYVIDYTNLITLMYIH